MPKGSDIFKVVFVVLMTIPLLPIRHSHSPIKMGLVKKAAGPNPEFTGVNVASLRGESSNQLLETLEEWNDYLDRNPAIIPGATAS